jgi:hypothetical protein
MITVNGIFDFDAQTVVAPDTGTWSALTTWASWTTYNTGSPDYLY